MLDIARLGSSSHTHNGRRGAPSRKPGVIPLYAPGHPDCRLCQYVNDAVELFLVPSTVPVRLTVAPVATPDTVTVA